MRRDEEWSAAGGDVGAPDRHDPTVMNNIFQIFMCTACTTNPLSSSPVRIPGFHPGDPGSNPGNGTLFKFVFLPVFFLS